MTATTVPPVAFFAEAASVCPRLAAFYAKGAAVAVMGNRNLLFICAESHRTTFAPSPRPTGNRNGQLVSELVGESRILQQKLQLCVMLATLIYIRIKGHFRLLGAGQRPARNDERCELPHTARDAVTITS
jgi:hypothetical protein